MSRFFYPRLALTNIRKNKNIYLPYLLASALMVLLLYCLQSVAIMIGQSGMAGGSVMFLIVSMCSVICAALSLFILFYLNRFAMKQRTRELGLFCILGMEKRHLVLVMLWEVLFACLFSLAAGILGGALLSQLLFLILMYLVGLQTDLTFHLPFDAVFFTLQTFLIGWLLIIVQNVLILRKSDPIGLLRSSREGEREPKTKWVTALVGLFSLLLGYAVALLVRAPSDAISAFFPATLLVIIGTYCLFTAGSIAALKLLRRKKRFYYQPKNFITISGMIYRMRQNAIGLANICILASAVLVTLSSCVCLYVGAEDMLREQFPREVRIYYRLEEQQPPYEAVEQISQRQTQAYGFSLQNPVAYTTLSRIVRQEGERFSSTIGGQEAYLHLYLLQDYNRMMGSSYALSDDELLVYDPLGRVGGRMEIEGRSYAVAGRVPIHNMLDSPFSGEDIIVILPQLADLQAFASLWSGSALLFYYWYDLGGDGDRAGFFASDLYSAYSDDSLPSLMLASGIDSSRESFYQLYGSLLFVGLFFVTLFLITTVLIIYYKQVTEGFDDRDRFQIMQKVGLSHKEVKQTIQQQIRMVFFLPIIMAFLHIAVAFPVLCKLLSSFNMTNTTLFIGCVAASALVFLLFYLLVYQLTARTYYKIVRA